MDKEYIDKMSRASRIQSQALAVLQRAKNSGIPPEYFRINRATFRAMLDDSYFSGKGQSADKVAEVIYEFPERLFKKKFILIDGGKRGGLNIKKAGFAILFRLIACDSSGIFKQSKDLISKLNSGWVSDSQGSRIDIAESLKNQEILFIDGLNPKHFKAGTKAYYEAGIFFDEILEHRLLNSLLTILSFDEPIKQVQETLAADGSCGNMLARFFEADNPELENTMKNEYKVSRIRVKEEK